MAHSAFSSEQKHFVRYAPDYVETRSMSSAGGGDAALAGVAGVVSRKPKPFYWAPTLNMPHRPSHDTWNNAADKPSITAATPSVGDMLSQHYASSSLYDALENEFSQPLALSEPLQRETAPVSPTSTRKPFFRADIQPEIHFDHYADIDVDVEIEHSSYPGTTSPASLLPHASTSNYHPRESSQKNVAWTQETFAWSVTTPVSSAHAMDANVVDVCEDMVTPDDDDMPSLLQILTTPGNFSYSASPRQLDQDKLIPVEPQLPASEAQNYQSIDAEKSQQHQQTILAPVLDAESSALPSTKVFDSDTFVFYAKPATNEQYTRALTLMPERAPSASTRTLSSRALCLLFQIVMVGINQYVFVGEFIAFNFNQQFRSPDRGQPLAGQLFYYFSPYPIAEPLVYLIPNLIFAVPHILLYYYCYFRYCPRIPDEFYLHPEDLLNAERLYPYYHAEAWKQISSDSKTGKSSTSSSSMIKPDVDNEDAQILSRLKYYFECVVPGPVMLRALAFDLIRKRIQPSLHERMPYYDNQRINVVEIRHRVCKFCLLLKPDRCHHCAGCGVCVAQRDHHCIYMQNCVHAYNIKQFLLMLLFGLLLGIWQSVVVIQFIIRQAAQKRLQLLSDDAIARQFIWVAVLFVTVIVCGVLNLSIISIEMYRHGAHNATMVEAMRKTYVADNSDELRARMLLVTRYPYERNTLLQNWRQIFGKHIWQWLIPCRFGTGKESRKFYTDYELGERTKEALRQRRAEARRNVYDYFELEQRIKQNGFAQAQRDGVLIDWKDFRHDFVEQEYFMPRRRRNQSSLVSLATA